MRRSATLHENQTQTGHETRRLSFFTDLAADRADMLSVPRLLRFFELLLRSLVLFLHRQYEQLADVANELDVFLGIEMELCRGPLGSVFSRQSVASVFVNSWIANEFGGFIERIHLTYS